MHLFKHSFAEKPESSLDIPELVEKLQEGFWKKDILNLRSKSGELSYKKLKSSLPAVTVSAELKSRDKTIPVEKRLKKHTGLICLDIDKKDNPKLRVKDIIDPECLLEYVSCSGEGKKIIYRCTPTLDSNEHRRIYDAAVLRLRDMGINIKVDPIVKSIASLQYVSYDPYLHYNAKSKVLIKPLPKPKKQHAAPSKDKEEVIAQLQEYIKALGKKDCTDVYENWLSIAFGLAHTLGENGRAIFHLLSKNHSQYAQAETDEKYDSVLDRNIESLEKPRTIASVFSIINEYLGAAQRKQLAKKYASSHAVAKGVEPKAKGKPTQAGEAEDNNNTDLEGMVRYKLFLFKKVIDKESKQVTDLTPHALNFNAFEALLKAKGFYRHEKMFVRVVDNIVDKCDADDVLRVITEHIEEEGDYHFTYKQTEFIISWEEIIHLWRKSRGNSTIYNQLRSSLLRWEANLLKDSVDVSYIPFKNGVVQVTKKGITMVEYSALTQQIWRERILPREYRHKATKTNTHKPGMFEIFFANVCGRGITYKHRVTSEPYKRAMWYYGYMLQGFKRQSVARAWLLYDILSGNNGRSGKTILGQAVGKIRSVVTIDGKTLDLNQRFAFQTVQPWTDVVFIDDPKKGMSLIPMFNMISGDFQADKKNEQPLVKPLKVMVASNWIMEAEGTSEAGRQFVTQLDDFYIRYSRDHNTIAPIVKAHGKEFFTGWDTKDWEQFDNFSLRCLQYHLTTEVPANTVVGNALLLRFIQSNEEEMFFELASIFSEHAKVNAKDGKLSIVMAMLTTAITEHSRHMKSLQAAGYVARGFLKCIGGGEIQITTIDVSGFRKQAYKLSCGWEGIDFGNYNDRIKRGPGNTRGWGNGRTGHVSRLKETAQ
jgi:hypothetical protein